LPRILHASDRAHQIAQEAMRINRRWRRGNRGAQLGLGATVIARLCQDRTDTEVSGTREIRVELGGHLERMNGLTKASAQMQNRAEIVVGRAEARIGGNGGAVAPLGSVKPAGLLIGDPVLEFLLPRHLWAATKRGELAALFDGLATDGFVVADDFLDDEGQELFREIRIELGFLCECAQACDLLGLARGIGRWQPLLCLEAADRLRALEALGQKMHQRRVDIVDAVAQPLKLGIGFGHGFPFGR